MEVYKSKLDFSKPIRSKPVNEHIGYACPSCGEFYRWNEFAAMQCCNNNNYACRYRRLVDGKLFDI